MSGVGIFTIGCPPKEVGMRIDEKIIIVLFILMIGISLGYWYRMIQIEPILNKEISLLYRENKLVMQENELLKARLASYQVSLKKKR